MASKPRRKRSGAFKLLPYPGTPEGVVELLSEALCRAQDDEVLATVVVEVGREGVIRTISYGDEHGYRHSMVAGLHYALHDLTALEDE